MFKVSYVLGLDIIVISAVGWESRLRQGKGSRWPPQIIPNKATSDAAWSGAGAGGAVAYQTVQIVATLRFGANDKVTAQIVISVTSAHDLRETFVEVPAR
ncbi:unnamed protein product [Colias eurytheme]|nr:unnamed protein product [Colias eurytheme]